MQTQNGGLQSGCDDKKKKGGVWANSGLPFSFRPHSLFMVFCEKKKREGLLAKLPNSSPSRWARAKLTAPPL